MRLESTCKFILINIQLFPDFSKAHNKPSNEPVITGGTSEISYKILYNREPYYGY